MPEGLLRLPADADAVIRLDFDARDYIGEIDALVTKEMPFAMAVALTRTAQSAQREVRAELKDRFTIRGNWVPGGIRIKPATKRNLAAEVGSKDAFMALQETGGVKKPRGRALAIPVGARRTKMQRTSRSRWPGALLQRKNTFLGKTRDGN